MDETIIKNWNDCVQQGDQVWICGDFAWNRHASYLHRLNGKKFIVLGSHDKMPIETLRLFAEVHNGMARRLFNKRVYILTHCAMRVWESSHYGSINLYGHSHGRLPESDVKRQMDVGVDVWGYRPVPLELVEAVMEDRLFNKGDGDRSPEELVAAVDSLRVRNLEWREWYESKIVVDKKEVNWHSTGK